MFFKLLNGVFRVETFYMKVAIKYRINLFFKFVIIRHCYYIVLCETFNFYLHLHIFKRFNKMSSTMFPNEQNFLPEVRLKVIMAAIRGECPGIGHTDLY